MKPFNFLPVAILFLLMAGCATQSPQTTQDKKTELCTNLARLNTSVAKLKSISASSTVGDLKNAQEQVRTAFSDVKTSAQAVQEAKAAELETAYNNLETAVRNVPNTATLQQASQSIAPQVAEVERAEAQMKAGLNCP